MFREMQQVGLKQPQMILTCKLCVDGEISGVIFRDVCSLESLIV